MNGWTNRTYKGLLKPLCYVCEMRHKFPSRTLSGWTPRRTKSQLGRVERPVRPQIQIVPTYNQPLKKVRKCWPWRTGKPWESFSQSSSCWSSLGVELSLSMSTKGNLNLFQPIIISSELYHRLTLAWTDSSWGGWSSSRRGSWCSTPASARASSTSGSETLPPAIVSGSELTN